MSSRCKDPARRTQTSDPGARQRAFTVAAGLLLLLLAPVGACAWQCTNDDLAGTWAWSAEGIVVKPEHEALAGPFAEAGLLTADENGGLTLSATASYNGLIRTSTAKGAFAVSTDCTVSASIEAPSPAGVAVAREYRGILGDNRREIKLLMTRPTGTTVVGVARPVSNAGECDGQEFRGSYTFELHGWLRGSPFRRLGTLLANGTGSLLANTLASYPAQGSTGEIRPETLIGNFSVGADCSLTLNTSVMVLGAPNVGTVSTPISGTFTGALHDFSRQAVLVGVPPSAEPGTVMLGTLKAISIGLTTTPPPAQILVSTQSLSFTAAAGGGASSQTFSYTLSDGSSRPVSVSAYGGGWLSVEVAGATTPGSARVSVNTQGLSAGTYSGSITVSVSGLGSRAVSVRLTIT